MTQTALNNTKEGSFLLEGGIFVASVRGNCYFCTGFFMFQDLERIFQSVKRTFQSLECTFQGLEYKKDKGVRSFYR